LQLYLSETFQYLLIVVGILVGFLAFWLGRKLTNKHIFHLDEYLIQYPQSKAVTNINEIIEKGSNVAALNIFLIVSGGIGSLIMFDRFLNNSNLGTYFLAVILLSMTCLFFSRIKELIFIIGLAPEKG